MADQLTEHLGDVVYNLSFRRDAARFLSLPKKSVDRLADLVERHGRFDVPAGDVLRFEQVCDLEDQGRQVLAAAQLIRQAVRRIGPPDERRQSLIDFAALMRVDPFQPDAFFRFFSELPKIEREERRNAAVAVAPTVVESQLLRSQGHISWSRRRLKTGAGHRRPTTVRRTCSRAASPFHTAHGGLTRRSETRDRPGGQHLARTP